MKDRGIYLPESLSKIDGNSKVSNEISEIVFDRFPKTVTDYLKARPEELVIQYHYERGHVDKSVAKISIPTRFYMRVDDCKMVYACIDQPSSGDSRLDLNKEIPLIRNDDVVTVEERTKNRIEAKNKTTKRLYKHLKDEFKRAMRST